MHITLSELISILLLIDGVINIVVLVLTFLLALFNNKRK